ncbi:hypothetical protein DRH29_03275 [candidate division Kazan bacterium]|uniref:Uncharacterized protein n=1 Tax=candidate division Kazan bacterium TaxID=2202143 RepID=A0A420ZCD6_UNCK3|nr:MAG: hypothetical protein DRH29_03275 [candidate division Kazan bacterium]
MENKIFQLLKGETEKMLATKEGELGIKLSEEERTRLANIVAGRIYGEWVGELQMSLRDLLVKKVKELNS